MQKSPPPRAPTQSMHNSHKSYAIHTQLTHSSHTIHTRLTHKDPVPEEKAKGSHLSQVHSEDTTHLLEGKYFLLFIPSGALHLPIVLLELGTGVEAGGRAGGAGHAIVTRVPVDRAWGQKPCQPWEAVGTCNNHRCSMLKTFSQSSEAGIQCKAKQSKIIFISINSLPSQKASRFWSLFLKFLHAELGRAKPIPQNTNF